MILLGASTSLTNFENNTFKWYKHLFLKHQSEMVRASLSLLAFDSHGFQTLILMHSYTAANIGNVESTPISEI